MASNPYSDLEVVPHAETLDQQKFSYSESQPTHLQPYAEQALGQKHYAQPLNDEDTNKIHQDGAKHEKDRSRTICGLRRKTFVILLVLAVVVIGAAVGGGVGGALGSKKKTENNSSQSTITTPTPSTTETPTVTTTSVVGPSATLLRDCDSSNNTIYTTQLGDTTSLWRKLCDNSLTNVNGFDSVVIAQFNTLNDCINACATYNQVNKTQIQSGKNRICNTVCWRNTFDSSNDQAPGACFGFTTQNITVSGQTQFKVNSPAETRCDSAGLMNQDF